MLSKEYKRDYFAEAHQLLKQQGYKSYIQRLLPGGKMQGNEYVVKNPTRNDNTARSFSINVITGKWSDFATDNVGNDLIGLTAYVKRISNIEACFYIGVPRPDNNKPQGDIVEFPKTLTSIETNIIDEEVLDAIQSDFSLLTHTEEDIEIEYTPEGINEALEALNEDIAQEDNLAGIEEQEDLEPPAITVNDTHYHNARSFNCKPNNFFPYKNALGVTIGYIVRWDVKTDSGITKKELRPYIYDFEKKRWVSKFFGQALPNSRPLYNLPEIIARPNVSVMIVEGEKTAEAAKILFPDYVITTSSGGAKAANKTDWSFLRDQEIIFSPDDGEAGIKYLQDVEKQLRNVRAKITQILEPNKLSKYIVQDGVITLRQGEVPKSYDLADSLADGWTAKLIKQTQENEDFAPFFKQVTNTQVVVEIPKEGNEYFSIEGINYALNAQNNTLYWELVKEDKKSEEIVKTWLQLSGYIKPTHCMKDANGDHGFLAKIVTRKKETIECFFSRDETATEKDTTKILLKKGLKIPHVKPANCYALNFYLNNFKPEFEAIGVDMVGWQGNNEAYMLPFVGDPRNSYLSQSKEKQPTEYILQQKGVALRVIEQKGTLEEWKRTVGQVCRNNHLHSFAILVSLASPALKLLGEEGGFFHYVGSTSIGKSTILNVAKSVWGFDKLGSFRTTDNALESICKTSNDGTLFLDEIGEIEADAFFKVIYMLANGVTKGRLDKNANAKNTTHFTVLAQSTGEIGLEAKLAEKKIQAKGGQFMRMAELDADRGKGLNTFDVLNINPDTNKHFITGREQAEYLKTHAEENCGVVIDSFLKAVVPNIENYIEMLKEAKSKWLACKLRGSEGVEVARMAKRFSTIFATGAVAIEFGIIPHSIAEIEACVDAMFTNWLERFGGDNPHELKTMETGIRRLCVEQQNSRFCNAHPAENENIILPKDKAGYWKMENDVLSEFWMYPSVFDREILKGRDKKVFYPLLVKDGYIAKGGSKGYTQSRRPAKECSQNFIVIPASVFHDED